MLLASILVAIVMALLAFPAELAMLVGALCAICGCAGLVCNHPKHIQDDDLFQHHVV
jgi:uncharacterized membrane protein YadS